MRAVIRIGRCATASLQKARLVRHLSTRQSISPLVHLSSRVREALSNGEPVVALESTIISHGMPYPQNIEIAQQVEAAVTANGSTPATIALIDGRIHVGLSDEELVRIGKGDEPVVKASRRDMAAVLSQRVLGATTVSGTMIAAQMAGISVFATGGIGGVHRGAENTMDISADLTELGRTPVAVVCSGAKSILDLPKTLEYLETQGVPVVAYGESNNFPAFFSPRSGLRAPWHMKTPEQVAALIRTNAELDLQSGMVIAVPIPGEHTNASAEIEQAIESALRDCEELRIQGKECTPFLLKRVVELTGGASLAANAALVKNNAGVAGKIARSLAAMGRIPQNHTRTYSTSITTNKPLKGQGSDHENKRPLLVIGGIAVDITSQIDPVSEKTKLLASSYPGTVRMTVGGVGQNIARAAHLLGANTALLSALGRDAFGMVAFKELQELGMDTRFLLHFNNGLHTAVYNALHASDGDLVSAVADMNINGMLSVEKVRDAFSELNPCVVGLDGNVSESVLAAAVGEAQRYGACIVYEPTSYPKCTNILSALSSIKRSETLTDVRGLVHILTPNQLEVRRMAEVALELDLVESALASEAITEIEGNHCLLDSNIIRDALTLLRIFPILIIKLGEKGVCVASMDLTHNATPSIHHIPPLKPNLIVNSNGAGDSLVGAVLAMLHQKQTMFIRGDHIDVSACDVYNIVQRAQRAAILSLESPCAISNKLTPKVIDEDY
ncbi:hypothetical protein H4R24_000313 [Coemansia sp. RSA 988]|nr:hypothetical protein H4R24_000313 [Coemansia sp. RSA 988]